MPMQKDAAILANEADKLVLRLEAVDKYYQEMDAELHNQVEQLGVQEERVETQKRNSESIILLDNEVFFATKSLSFLQQTVIC